MGAQGTGTVNFGVFPGSSDTSVTVTGQVSILAGSLAEAWIFPTATADHSADEHMVETIKVFAGNIVAGVGFTIYAFDTNQLCEPVTPQRLARFSGTGEDAGLGQADNGAQNNGGKFVMPYGRFTVGWVWN